jgi:hypothetical protein
LTPSAGPEDRPDACGLRKSGRSGWISSHHLRRRVSSSRNHRLIRRWQDRFMTVSELPRTLNGVVWSRRRSRLTIGDQIEHARRRRTPRTHFRSDSNGIVVKPQLLHRPYISKAERDGPFASRLLWRTMLIPEPDLPEHAHRSMVNRLLTGAYSASALPVDR